MPEIGARHTQPSHPLDPKLSYGEQLRFINLPIFETLRNEFWNVPNVRNGTFQTCQYSIFILVFESRYATCFPRYVTQSRLRLPLRPPLYFLLKPPLTFRSFQLMSRMEQREQDNKKHFSEAHERAARMDLRGAGRRESRWLLAPMRCSHGWYNSRRQRGALEQRMWAHAERVAGTAVSILSRSSKASGEVKPAGLSNRNIPTWNAMRTKRALA